MINTSAAYRNAVVQPSRTWSLNLSIELANGSTISITEKNIMFNTLTFKESSTCTNNIQVGSTFSNSLNFTLVNPDGEFNDVDFSRARVTAQVGLLVGDEYEQVSLGVFNLVTGGKKLSTIPMNCLDDMYRLNVPFANVGLVPPMNLQSLVGTMCTYCNVSVSSELVSELTNLNLTLDTLPEGDLTCRDVLGFVGVLLGKNLRFNRNGFLESFWYTSKGQTTTASTRVQVSSYEDYVVHVTGVSMQDAQENIKVVGTEDYVLEFEANPLILTEEVLTEVANRVLGQLSSISFRPCKVYFMGDPSWQCGDIIEHVREGITNVVSPIMLSTWKFRGTQTLEAKGVAPEQDAQLTAAAKRLLSLKLKSAQDLIQGLDNMQKTILNQTSLITNSLGFYPKYEYDENGAVVAVYLMSTPESTDSTTVWAFTINGIGVSHTGIDGPYTSAWTADDTITASVITANMIRAGVLQSLDGSTFYLDLDNGILRMNADNIVIKASGKSISDELQNLDDKIDKANEGINDQINEAIDNIDSVTTSTGYTFDAKGLTITKEGEAIKNLLDNSGMYVYRNDDKILQANDDGVEAINLTAKQYLIVGQYSRFEDYSGDDGTPRTGCFWKGGA